MSDLGPSVADIDLARNQALQHEAEMRGQQMQLEVEADTAQELAEELKAAHLAALCIKDILPDPIQDTTQTQAFAPESAAMPPPATSSQGPSVTEKVQAGTSDLYNKAKDTAAAAGQSIKDTVTPSDQSRPTASQQGPSIAQKVQAGAADLSAKAQHAAAAAGSTIKETVAPSHTSSTSTTTAHGPSITQKVQAGAADLYNNAASTAAAAGSTIKENVAPSHTTSSSSTTTHHQSPTITQKVHAGAADLYNKAASTAAAASSTIKETVAPSHHTTSTTTSTTTTPATTTTGLQGPSIAQKVQAGAAHLAAKVQQAAAAAGSTIKETVAPSHTITTTTSTQTTQHGPSITQKVQAGAADLHNKAASTAAAAGSTIKEAVAPSHHASSSSTTTSHHEGPTITQKVQAGAADLYNKAAGTAAAAAHTVKETVAPSHTSSSSTTTTTTHHEGPTLTQKVQAAQAQLYSKAANTASAAGGAIKGTIASADQATTTKLRDATAAVGQKTGAALSGTADGGVGLAAQAGGLFTQAKEAVKGALGLAPEAEGSPATAYEGAVFSSDDPEYKDAAAGKQQQTSATTESRTPAPTLGEFKGAPLAGAPAGSDDTTTTTSATTSSTTSSGGKDSGLLEKLRQPIIFSPKEPTGSLGAGSVGVAAGDPAGGANIVAAARTAGKGIMESLGLGSTAGAPAGPPPDIPDPRTEGVAVGDFKGLKEALAATRDTPSAAATAGGRSSSGSDAALQSAEQMDTASNSAGSTDAAAGPDGAALKQGYEQMKDSAQQSYEDVKSSAQGKMDSATQAASEAVGGVGASGGTAATGGAGGGIFAGLASLVTDIATKVNLASNSEELMAGGLVPDDAAGPAAAAGATAQQPAPEAAAAADAAADKMSAAKDAAADTMASAAQAVVHAMEVEGLGGSGSSGGSIAAAAGQDGRSMGEAASDAAAAAAKEKASDMAASAQAAVSDAAAAAAQDKASDTAAAAAKDVVSGGAAAAQDKASEAAAATKNAATSAQGEASGAAERVQGAGSSLVQGAKEGFVSAYDAAAGAAASAADTNKHTAAHVTGSSSSSSSAGQPAASAGDSAGDGFGHGSGSSSSPSGGGYAGGERSSLGQAWEDLKHGGSKAPWAVSSAGETAAPHDVTSNVERSKHLDDAHQAKIYDAEVYKVSPGSQTYPLSDQEQTRAAAGAVAGAKHQVKGTVPHGKPETSKVTPDQPNRFAADKGIGTGFGTGSAAGWHTDSVKRATHHFVTTSSSSAGGAALDQTPAGSSSAAQGGVRGWVRSLTAVWDNIGRAAAVGPTGKDVPKDFDNASQDVMVDPVRGAVKIQGQSPGNKVMMRPADQVPTGGSASDPHKVQHKVERLGKAVVDSLTTSSEEAAADPTNLKGKSSDNKPDGTDYFLKREAAEAIEGLKETPHKVAGALGTAVEIGSGVLQHIGEKVGDAAHMVAHPGARTAGNIARQQRAEAGVARVAAGGGAPGDGPSEGAPRIHSMNVGTGGAGDMQVLEEQRMAAIESPADKRETLGDKIIGPLVSDMKDETHAKELAVSWKEYKAEQQQSGGSGSGPTPGSSPAAMSSSADPSGSKTPPTAGAADTAPAAAVDTSSAGATEQHQAKHHTHFWQRYHKATTTSSLAEDAKDAAQSATDSAAHAAGKVTGKVEGAAEALRDKVEDAAAGVANAARDTADEARSTAAAAGDVAKMEVQSGVESAAHGAGRAAGAVSRSLEEGKQQAAAAGEAASNAAGGLLSSVGCAAKSLLGGLLGPFEREAAFEENTAVVSGTPPKPEPVGVEQMTGGDAASLDANRAAGRGATEHSGRSVGAAVGAKVQQARGAAPPAGDAVEVSMLQAGIDDAAKAAGLTAGHIESSAGAVAQKVAAAQEVVKEQLAAAAENIERVYNRETPFKTQMLPFSLMTAMAMASIVFACVCGLLSGMSKVIGLAVTAGVMLICCIAMHLMCHQYSRPSYRAPFFPNLPAASLLLNSFLMSSLPARAYMQLAIFFAVVTMFYMFYSIHSASVFDKKTQRGLTGSQAIGSRVGLAMRGPPVLLAYKAPSHTAPMQGRWNGGVVLLPEDDDE